ncbi:hypothetical protein YC2023_049369 [Brassica napus]
MNPSLHVSPHVQCIYLFDRVKLINYLRSECIMVQLSFPWLQTRNSKQTHCVHSLAIELD